MPLRQHKLHVMLPAVCLVLSAAGTVLGQQTGAPAAHEVVAPPACTNNKGENVGFIDRQGGRTGFAAAMAARDTSGKPVVYRSNYAAAPPDYQRFIDRHECAHHQTGDVDRPHPPRNSPEHLMTESISDCVAILRLRDEDGYDRPALARVTAAMSDAMAQIGFPQISITSRISNIDNCFAKYGSPNDFVEGILKQRGLL